MKTRYFYLLLVVLALSSCKKEPESCFDYGILGLKVNFDATCSLNATTYAWDFGDGGSSTIAMPQHTYAAYGQYAVTLTVATKGGKTATSTSNVLIGAGAGEPVNTLFDGLYSLTETCTTGTRTYSVVVAPNATRDSEASFNGLGFTGGVATAVIDAGATTFSIARQTLVNGKDIVSTSGTINSTGTRIDLSYKILNASNGALMDECVAVLRK